MREVSHDRCSWPARAGAVLVCLLLYGPSVQSQDYSEQGADSCVVCHGAGMPLPAVDLFATKHGSRLDPAAPFSQLQCETCHGPAEAHAQAQSRGEDRLPDIVFGQDSPTPVETQNRVCLGCHDYGARNSWTASPHESASVACAACHQVHRQEDRVFDATAQQEACFECHPQRRSDSLKTSSHPLRFGAMTCSSCHDPHKGDNEFLLREATVNETCYLCHAEKRGPFLWEHAPVTEDCTLCHQPHGSNHAALLRRQPPLLCQQCHAPAGHPSVAYTSEGLEDDSVNRFMLARACLNCHSQVHGSNQPSGATLHR